MRLGIPFSGISLSGLIALNDSKISLLDLTKPEIYGLFPIRAVQPAWIQLLLGGKLEPQRSLFLRRIQLLQGNRIDASADGEKPPVQRRHLATAGNQPERTGKHRGKSCASSHQFQFSSGL